MIPVILLALYAAPIAAPVYEVGAHWPCEAAPDSICSPDGEGHWLMHESKDDGCAVCADLDGFCEDAARGDWSRYTWARDLFSKRQRGIARDAKVKWDASWLPVEIEQAGARFTWNAEVEDYDCQPLNGVDGWCEMEAE